MPIHDRFDLDLEKLSSLLDQLPAAVSILDLDANLVYYSENAPNFVNRKPEFLGQDIKNCHKLQSSNEKIDKMIEGFKGSSISLESLNPWPLEPLRYQQLFGR